MRIAIVKLSAMGDIIHSMVALQFIKKYNQSIIIDWFIEESFKEILTHNPHINNIYSLNLKKIKKDKLSIFSQIKLIKEYSSNNYDLIIDAQGLVKSAIVSKLLGRNTAGFDFRSARESLASIFYKNKIKIDYSANTIDRNIKILSYPLGFNISSTEILIKKHFLFFKKEDDVIYTYLLKSSKNIIFVIGSTWKSRNYPKEKILKIIKKLKENCLIIWGNNSEKEDALWIAKNSKYATVMPKINLNSLKALIYNADLLIGNDTGPTHMAWGLNIPSITIFGPTPINRVYQTSINKVIKSSSIVNHYKLNKNDFSIQKIDENKIINIAKSLLYG